MTTRPVSYRTMLRKIILARGKIMSATFVKETGEVREMTFRRGVATQVKNNPFNDKNDSRLRVKRRNLITVVEMDGMVERKWKTINLHTLKELKIDKESYVIEASRY